MANPVLKINITEAQAMLCLTCRTIFAAESKIHANKTSYFIGIPREPDRELQPNIWDLQKAAINHCQICRHVWNQIQRRGGCPSRTTSDASNTNEWWKQSVLYSIQYTSGPEVVEFQFHLEGVKERSIRDVASIVLKAGRLHPNNSPNFRVFVTKETFV